MKAQMRTYLYLGILLVSSRQLFDWKSDASSVNSEILLTILRVVMTCAPKAQKCKRRNLKRLHFVFEALLGITTSIFVYIYIYICLIQHDNFHIGIALKGFSSSKVLYTDPKHFFKPHFTSDHQFAFYTVKTSTYTSPFYPRCVFFRQ